ncbi:hypothetical protein AB835_09280 [Candidatus Endobugula sertula]|uniref:MSHA biogenesis protein MshK n=1 Tax=Candidatus Endobugula sertula TaxID=62101 RepID=A0A1D2QP26_9GAMM|nr:hypothetical protein AB835_09280 [Candidatus Endobugula sertula]
MLFNHENIGVFLLTFLFLVLTSPFSYSLNDPTKPIYSVATTYDKTSQKIVHSSKELLLQSIFLSKEKKIVVVNGDILREGSFVDGVMVDGIHESYVTMKYKGNTVKLMLSKKIYLDEVTGEVIH